MAGCEQTSCCGGGSGVLVEGRKINRSVWQRVAAQRRPTDADADEAGSFREMRRRAAET